MRSATKKQTGKDKAYRRFIGEQPCVCCRIILELQIQAFRVGRTPQEWHFQSTDTECAHLGPHGLSQKAPDTLPLCRDEHHQYGSHSAHKLGKHFAEYWKLDLPKLFEKYRNLYLEQNT